MDLRFVNLNRMVKLAFAKKLENRFSREAIEIVIGYEEDYEFFYHNGYVLLEDYLEMNTQFNDLILDASARIPDLSEELD